MDANSGFNPYQTPAVSADDGFDVASGSVSPSTIEVLKKTRPWVLFLGGLGFFLAALFILGGIGFVIFVAVRGAGGVGAANVAELIAVAIVYAVMGMFYLAPAGYLIRYAKGIKRLSSEPTLAVLNETLTAQKSFWKFVGIIVALVFGLYALMAVLVMVAFAVGAAI